jgi:hypothetical protein
MDKGNKDKLFYTLKDTDISNISSFFFLSLFIYLFIFLHKKFKMISLTSADSPKAARACPLRFHASPADGFDSIA